MTMQLIGNAQGFDFYKGIIDGETAYNIVPDTQKAPITGYCLPLYVVELKGLHPSMIKHFFKEN